MRWHGVSGLDERTLIDDLNDMLGCYGDSQARTPNIDRLAAMGMRFERAYCPAPLCNPSRTALFTGIRPHASGIYRNEPWFRDLPDLRRVVTLPQAFAAAGYRAEGAGKLFHHADGAMSDPASWQRIFSRGNGTLLPERRHAHGMQEQIEAGYMRQAFDWGACPSGGPDARHVRKAAELLRRARADDPPFFLAVGLFRPHLPWYAPQEFFDRHPLEQVQPPAVPADDLADLPATGAQWAENAGIQRALEQSGRWREAVRAYRACVSYTDHLVGELLDAAAASPVAGSTIIVLCSDHGFHLGEKRHWEKYTLWERANRVPFLIVAPGVTSGGSVCATPVSTMHLFATLCDLAGIGVPEQVVDRSLLPLLRDPSAAWDAPALMTHYEGNHAVRDRRYRYIRYADGGEELYDHDDDPHEWRNRAADPALAAVKEGLVRQLPSENRGDRHAEWQALTNGTAGQRAGDRR